MVGARVWHECVDSRQNEWWQNCEKTENLAVSAQTFRKGASRVRKVRFLGQLVTAYD